MDTYALDSDFLLCFIMYKFDITSQIKLSEGKTCMLDHSLDKSEMNPFFSGYFENL